MSPVTVDADSAVQLGIRLATAVRRARLRHAATVHLDVTRSPTIRTSRRSDDFQQGNYLSDIAVQLAHDMFGLDG